MRMLLGAVAVLAACGGSTSGRAGSRFGLPPESPRALAPPAETPAAITSAQTAPGARYASWARALELPPRAATWILGRWSATDGRGIEHWVAAGDRMWGVSLSRGASGGAPFEIMYLENLGPNWVFFAMPGGGRAAPFQEIKRRGQLIAFQRRSPDFPSVIEYARQGDALTAKLRGGGPEVEFVFAPDQAPIPEEMAGVDAAFVRSFAAGPEATFALLDDDVVGTEHGGASWRGRAAFEPELGRLVAAPSHLRPHAVTGGLAPDGASGYTLGELDDARYDVRRIYVAIWVKTPAGWRLRHLHLGA